MSCSPAWGRSTASTTRARSGCAGSRPRRRSRRPVTPTDGSRRGSSSRPGAVSSRVTDDHPPLPHPVPRQEDQHMTTEGAVVVVGGTRAIGLEIARHYAEAGSRVVITGRSRESVDGGLAELPAGVEGVVFDLAEPDAIDAALAGVGPVRRLVLVAIDRDANSIADYSIERATRLVTLKLVGFTQVVVSLRERFTEDAALVLFGGMAKDRP